jgi:hypothetical protein
MEDDPFSQVQSGRFSCHACFSPSLCLHLQTPQHTTEESDHHHHHCNKTTEHLFLGYTWLLRLSPTALLTPLLLTLMLFLVCVLTLLMDRAVCNHGAGTPSLEL